MYEGAMVVPGSTGSHAKSLGQIFKVQDFGRGWQCQLYGFVFWPFVEF